MNYFCKMLKETVQKAAEAGAAVLQQFFVGKFTISSKSGINDLVTEADYASEKVILEIIKKQFPD
ncbi:MAG: inositol monophosphatase family protein, partial [Chitinophagaceae bacterium]